MAFIRQFRDGDERDLYDVCVRTADAGDDARGHYSSDDLMGDLFAVPYAYLCPEMTFVVDDGSGRVVGYIVGTPETGDFVRRYRAEWIPLVGDRYPVPPKPPRTPEENMVALHFWPERMLVPELAEYPAHLHIDLLPEYQRQGWGRGLMEYFLEAAARAGATGAHLGMVTANVRARAFYDRLGFKELPVPDPGPLTYLGVDLKNRATSLSENC